jgi:hypothetical protein
MCSAIIGCATFSQRLKDFSEMILFSSFRLSYLNLNDLADHEIADGLQNDTAH